MVLMQRYNIIQTQIIMKLSLPFNEKEIIAGLSILSLFAFGVGVYKDIFHIGCFSNSNDRHQLLKKQLQSIEKEQQEKIRLQEQEILKQLDEFTELQTLLTAKAQQFQLSFLKNIVQGGAQILTKDCLKDIFEFTSQIIDKKQLQRIYDNSRKARRSIFDAILQYYKNYKKIKESVRGSSIQQNDHQNIAINSEQASLANSRILHQENSGNDMLQSHESGMLSVYEGEQIDLNPIQIYYKYVCTFEEEIQYLVESTQKDFVVFFNIPYEIITGSINYHMENQSQFREWIKNWSFEIKEILQTKLHLYASPIKSDLILELLEYQIEHLKQSEERYVDYVKIIALASEEEKQIIPTFLSAYLEDLVYLKHEVQIQQINLSQEDINEGMREMINQLQELQSNILQKMMHSVGRMDRTASVDNEDF